MSLLGYDDTIALGNVLASRTLCAMIIAHNADYAQRLGHLFITAAWEYEFVPHGTEQLIKDVKANFEEANISIDQLPPL